VERPPSRAALREAIRLLAADPSSRPLLLTIMQDKGGSGDVRRVAAIALQSLAPDQFEAAARPIVLDEDEDEQLRALAVNALAHFGDPATFGQDDELVRRVEELGAESDSPEVREAAAGFLSRYRK
jgi:HEAT repeat protein